MKIKIAPDALIVLVGAMGTGKSTFSRQNFYPHETLSTDKLREDLTGDFRSQSVNGAVFEIAKVMLSERARAGLLTVVDSTGTGTIINHATSVSKRYNRALYFFVFDPLSPEEFTQERMAHRWHHKDIYDHQVQRVAGTQYPKEASVIRVTRGPTDNTFTSPQDGNLIELEFEAVDSIEAHSITMQAGDRFMVIPDLHGCDSVARYLQEHIPQDVKFICLGDVVDRGPSSYNTFTIINEMRKSGRLIPIISNHDNKFYRWCKKFLAPVHAANEDTVSFGMKIADGLDKTIGEFYELDVQTRNQYARDFVEYYHACHPVFSIVDRRSEVHIFAHAGISRAVFDGGRFTESDLADFMYHDHKDVEEIVHIKNESELKHAGSHFFIHTGHNFKYNKRVRDMYESHISSDRSVTLIEHDIGLGKARFTPMDVKLCMIRSEETPFGFWLLQSLPREKWL